jgi:hypothetical protein
MGNLSFEFVAVILGWQLPRRRGFYAKADRRRNAKRVYLESARARLQSRNSMESMTRIDEFWNQSRVSKTIGQSRQLIPIFPTLLQGITNLILL